MKKTQLWTVLFAFVFGQLIQLVTNAMAHYLYVSDPVMMCLTVGVVTVALVVLTAIFVAMPQEKIDYSPAHTYKSKRDDIGSVIPPIFRNWKEKPALESDHIDITEEDETIRKENSYVDAVRKAQ